MKRGIAAAMAAALMVVLMASPVSAVRTKVTAGQFSEFATGADGIDPDYDINGRVVMVRTAAGHTIVVVTVRGLDPNTEYGSHVHKAACNSPDFGNGHYRFGEAGIVGAVDVNLSGETRSEIWPGPVNTNASGHASGWTVVGATAGPEAVSVVIHAPGGARIACADLA
jgi:Cu-Zn family superoxide dismutase